MGISYALKGHKHAYHMLCNFGHRCSFFHTFPHTLQNKALSGIPRESWNIFLSNNYGAVSHPGFLQRLFPRTPTMFSQQRSRSRRSMASAISLLGVSMQGGNGSLSFSLRSLQYQLPTPYPSTVHSKIPP